VHRVRRGGAYYRVCDPSWADPSDTSYSRRFGGRWNPPDRDGRPGFGALYLNRTIAAARANAQRHIRAQFGNVASIYDLLPERLPDLQCYDVRETDVLDAATPAGIAALGLAPSYPTDIPHPPCQGIAEAAYEAGDAGIAALSAVEPAEEELVVFDRAVPVLVHATRREPFEAWYPASAEPDR
jgi:RES domain-containing protein